MAYGICNTKQEVENFRLDWESNPNQNHCITKSSALSSELSWPISTIQIAKSTKTFTSNSVLICYKNTLLMIFERKIYFYISNWLMIFKNEELNFMMRRVTYYSVGRAHDWRLCDPGLQSQSLVMQQTHKSTNIHRKLTFLHSICGIYPRSWDI